ncbi:MAG: hypothetical protein Q4B23_05905 [Helcococcus sp.]|nr:hypothetical protein [Helcococcus sp.]
MKKNEVFTYEDIEELILNIEKEEFDNINFAKKKTTGGVTRTGCCIIDDDKDLNFAKKKTTGGVTRTGCCIQDNGIDFKRI